MTQLKKIWKKAIKLAIAGGVAFWVITFALSLTPIAVEYRTALSISYLPIILIESVLGGMIISYCLSYSSLRFYDKIPTGSPILKSVILSFVALGIGLILVYVSASQTSIVLQIFLIGTIFNIPRFLSVGIVIDYAYKRI